MHDRKLSFLVTVITMLAVFILVSCKISVPVDAEGRPTGGPATIGPSASGETEVFTIDPEGVETKVDGTVSPTSEEVESAIGGAITAASGLLPPPWNLIGLFAGFIPMLFRKGEDK